MTRVLITGKNGYIGKHVSNWLKKNSNIYSVETLDLRDSNWINFELKNFEIVIHAAAIVHSKKKDDKFEYFEINTKLTTKLAQKCKQENVRKFIFISTMSVYGLIGSLDKTEVIDFTTIENPKTKYAVSKLEAEKALYKLIDKNFDVAILRPPMIYGLDSPGNYSRLLKFYKFIAVLPDIKNIRSALNINRFLQLIMNFLDNDYKSGIYILQDEVYFETNRVLSEHLKTKKIMIIRSKFMALIIRIFLKKVPFIKKIYGNLVYDKEFKYKKIIELE